MTGRPRRHLAALAGALVLVAGCTASSDEPEAGSTAAGSESPSTSAPARTEEGPSADPPPAPPPPPERGCYRLPYDELSEPSSSRRPVDCDARHDAQTFHVGTLDLVVDGHQLAVDSDRVVASLDQTCERRLARFVGGSREDRRLTLLRPVWFAPTLDEADRGARWFRCDVVAPAGGTRLHPLPPPRALRGLLDRPAGDDFALCGTAAPGSPDFTRVICARNHSWRAVATIDMPRERRFPGVGVVRAAGDTRCSDLVRGLAGDPLRFRYGWEWPSREQWRAGQRHGFCWAPD